MRTCFVPFCDVKNKDQPNRTMFLVPKEPTLFAQWVEALPKVRTLRHMDKVCHLHFRPNDVVYTFDHCINGQIYKIKRDRPRLKPDAVPCLEMVTKKELLSYRVKHRLPSNPKVIKTSDDTLSEQVYDFITEEHQPVNEATNIIDTMQIQEEQVENCSIIVSLEDDMEHIPKSHEQITITKDDECENQEADLVLENSNYECIESNEATSTSEHLARTKQMNLFNLLYDKAHEVLTPNSLWGIHRSPNRSLICFSYMDVMQMQVTKIICIKTDGSVQLLVNGVAIETLKLLQDVKDLNDLSIVLNKVDMWHLCFEKSSNPNYEIIVESND